MLDSHWHTYSMLYIYLFELFFTNQMQGSKQTGLSEHLQICAHPVWFPQQLSSTRCRLLAGSQGIPGKQWNCRRRRNTSGWFNMWLSWLVNIAPINTHLEKTESIRGFLMILHFTTAKKKSLCLTIALFETLYMGSMPFLLCVGQSYSFCICWSNTTVLDRRGRLEDESKGSWRDSNPCWLKHTFLLGSAALTDGPDWPLHNVFSFNCSTIKIIFMIAASCHTTEMWNIKVMIVLKEAWK